MPASSFAYLDAPFRWDNPKTWPWFLYIWLAFFVFGWLKPLWRWLYREQAKSWPSTSARIDSAYIAEPKRLLGLTFQPNRNRTLEAVLAYSYTLSGNSFRGEYRRSCGSEEEANEFLRGLEGQQVPVHYNSSKPARSVLLEETVETMLRDRPPVPDSVKEAFSLDSLPAWLKPFVGVFSLIAIVGFCLSFSVHIGALFGRRVLPSYFFGVLHAGVFAVSFPAILVAQKRVGSTTRKDFWKAVTRGAPDGLRYFLYFLFFYTFLSSIPSFLHTPPGVAPQKHDALFDWRESSSIWMVFYCASFTILSSALKASRQRA